MQPSSGVVEAATGCAPEVPDTLLGCLDKAKESTVLPPEYELSVRICSGLKAGAQALGHSADGHLLVFRMKLSWWTPRRGLTSTTYS